MFSLFRSQKNVVRWVLGGLLTLVAFSMVITLIPGLLSNPTQPTDLVLGEVDGTTITAREVATRMVTQGVPADLPLNAIVLSSASAVNALVERKVQLREADKFGLYPNEQEVAEWVQFQMPFLFPEGVFVGTATYAQYVQQTYKLSIPEFEQQLADSIAVDTRLKQLVTSNILVTNAELEETYRARHEEASIEYVTIAAADFTSRVRVSEEELRETYEREKAQHRIPETRTVKLLVMDDSSLPVPEVAESRLRQYYAQNRESYRVSQQARASHILFLGDLDDPDAEVPAQKAKAEEVLKKIRDGADYDEMAKEHSEDTANVEDAGDLGWFGEGEYPAEFEKAAFALEPEAISDVVKSTAGYHIIKLQEKVVGRTKPFEEVRDQLLSTLRQETMFRDRAKLIDRVAAAARAAGANLEQVGQEFNVEVRTLPAFNVNTPPAGIVGDQVFINTLFTNEPGNPAVSTAGGITKIGVVSAFEPMRLAEFEEVRAKIRDSAIARKSEDLAQQRAQQIAEEAQKPGASLRRVGTRLGDRARISEFFKSSDLVQYVGRAVEIGPEPFSGEFDVVTGPRKVGDNFVIFRPLERREADMAGFIDERDNIRRTQLDMKRNGAFRLYTEAKVTQYEANGRVSKHEERVREFAQLYSRNRTN